MLDHISPDDMSLVEMIWKKPNSPQLNQLKQRHPQFFSYDVVFATKEYQTKLATHNGAKGQDITKVDDFINKHHGDVNAYLSMKLFEIPTQYEI